MYLNIVSVILALCMIGACVDKSINQPLKKSQFNFKNIEHDKARQLLKNASLNSSLSKKYDVKIYKLESGYLIKRSYYSQLFLTKESLITYLENTKESKREIVEELAYQRTIFDDSFYEKFIEISNSFVLELKLGEPNLSELDRTLNLLTKGQRDHYKQQITAFIGHLIFEKNPNSKWLRFQNQPKNQFVGASIVLGDPLKTKVIELYELVKSELKKNRIQFSENKILISILN
ncbi:MAG: hypothetical protein RJA76_968 [Bacteroidota bacterium]|jgi:hypothetical protein